LVSDIPWQGTGKSITFFYSVHVLFNCQVNGEDVEHLRHKEAQDRILSAGNNFTLTLSRLVLPDPEPEAVRFKC
jgi:hypothetical protein